jgi:hypothetical protein
LPVHPIGINRVDTAAWSGMATPLGHRCPTLTL